MILCHFSSRLFVLIFILLSFSINAVAKETIDDKVKKLTLELRCMTCQNQSIYDSDAEFSNDIKKIVRAKFEEGKSNREIKEFLVSRYGEYILFKPLLNYKNLFLWAFPFILLVFSLIFLTYRIKKR